MLEPLFRCNLACAGCGKIQYPAHILKNEPHARRMLQGGRRVRRADGVHPRRRAADASADRRDRRRPGRAQEIHLSLHQRAAAEREARSVQAQQVSDVLASTWTASASITISRSAAKAATTWPSKASREAVKRGFRVTTNTTLFDGADPNSVRALLRRDDGARRRRHDAFAGLLLRQGSRPAAFPGPRTHAPAVPRDSVESQDRAGGSTSRRCSSNS